MEWRRWENTNNCIVSLNLNVIISVFLAKSWYDDQTTLSCWKSSFRRRLNPGVGNGPIYDPCLNYTKTVRRACWTRWTLLSHSFPTRSGAVVLEVVHVRGVWEEENVKQAWRQRRDCSDLKYTWSVQFALHDLSSDINSGFNVFDSSKKKKIEKNKHSPQIPHCVILNIKNTASVWYSINFPASCWLT